MEDNEEQDLLTTAEWVHQHLLQHPSEVTLLHCDYGVSRSVSVGLYHLIKDRSITYKQAMGLVLQHRTCASPNPSFIQQLKSFSYQDMQHNQDED